MRATNRTLFPALAMGLVCLVPAPGAGAAMGNTATMYGLMPADLASVQALSMFNRQSSAAFYNPAYLARQEGTELSLGELYSNWELNAKSQGGSDPAQRSGKTLQDGSKDQLRLGLTTDLSGALRTDHPIGLGVLMGIDDTGQAGLSFESETAPKGQFVQFGEESIFLVVGLGTKVWRGIDLGIALNYFVDIQADAAFTLDSLSNDPSTSDESADVEADFDISQNFSINVDWGKTLCPESRCWAERLETAVSYREQGLDRTTLVADTDLSGIAQLTIPFTTVDNFQPAVTALGQTARLGRWRLALTVEHQQWSELEDILRRDTIKSVADAGYRDIVVPRFAAEYNLGDHLSFTGGFAYRDSPLESTRTPDANLLDSDRLIFGLGSSIEFTDPYVLAKPVQFDLAYQFHYLQDREFELTTREQPDQPFETVIADGSAHALMGTMTVRF